MIARLLTAALILPVLLAAACASPGDAARESGDSATSVAAPSVPRGAESLSAPALVVDSARPMSVLIERFQQGIPSPTQLENAAPSRDALVRGLVQALVGRDTGRVAALFVTRAEFAWLYFPGSTLSRPPYEIDPAFAWFQLSSESEKGVHKALGILGGTTAQYIASQCDPKPATEGAVRVWSTCTVRWRSADGTETEAALFASIIEHEGRFKFFSYSNRL